MGQDELIVNLMNNRIQTRPIWGLTGEQIPYLDRRSYEITETRRYWEHVINIPYITNLGIEDVEFVCWILGKGKMDGD